MNKTQSNQFTMFLALQQFLDEQTGVWSAIARLTAYKNLLDELISRIMEKSQEAESDTKVSDRKEKLKVLLGIKLSSLAGTVEAYAYDLENEDLAKQVHTTKSDVQRLKDTDVEPRTNTILHIVREHLSDLADFGVTQDTVDEVQTTLDEYQALLGKPRSILNKKYVALDTLEQLFGECNQLLDKKMDNMMLRFREVNPEFYDGYQRARTIVDK